MFFLIGPVDRAVSKARAHLLYLHFAQWRDRERKLNVCMPTKHSSCRPRAGRRAEAAVVAAAAPPPPQTAGKLLTPLEGRTEYQNIIRSKLRQALMGYDDASPSLKERQAATKEREAGCSGAEDWKGKGLLLM